MSNDFDAHPTEVHKPITRAFPEPRLAYSAVEEPAILPTSGAAPVSAMNDQVTAPQLPRNRWNSSSELVAKVASRPATGVRVGPFVGAVVVTSVITALLVAVLTWALRLIIRWVPQSYWPSAGVLPPVIDTELFIGWAVTANLAFAGLLFVLIKLGIAPVGRWFGLLTFLATALAVVAVISSAGPWQHLVPLAAVIAIVGLAMSAWCRGYGQATTLNRNDF